MKISIDFLGITEKKQEQIFRFNRETRFVSCGLTDIVSKDYVIFTNGQYAFLLAHGSKEGYIQIKGSLYTPQAVCDWLAPLAKKQDIKQIYTISCFGGKQASVECNGFSMESFHPSIEEVTLMELIDGVSFVFDITEEELNSWTLLTKINQSKDFEIFRIE